MSPTETSAGPPADRPSATPPPREPRRSPLWHKLGLPLITATLVPLLLLGVLELGLRAVGYGAPTSFFLPVEGRDGVLTTNPRFGWRVFPRELAREPVPAEVAVEKGAGTVRVFVLGGSAALGTPEPAFGFGRMFHVLLREAWPETDFEVVVGAMAAVNSHVVRLVAEEVADHEPDLVLVYLGNNEVVGPYGPGSVFGRETPRLGWVRAALAARGTRLGQLLQAPARALQGGGTAPERWRGLEMFIDRPVVADDPRLDAVYRHLQANLEAIVEVATGAGAEIALSTVAVNLLDSPPFGSRSADLAEGERVAWEEALEAGTAAWSAGRFTEAVASFQAAADLDPGHAELRYRLGRALLTLGRVEEAAEHLRAARDLDTLRFRADSEINRVIREVAIEQSGGDGGTIPGNVHLVDAEAVLGDAASTLGLPGDDLFWEHVHLRVAGNDLLARAFFAALRPALTARLGPAAGPPPPSDAIARALGLSATDRLAMAETILAMTADRPPFAGQLEAADRTESRRAEVRRLRLETAGPAAARRDLALDRAARDAWPGDLLVRQGLAETLHRQGDPAAAAREWRRLVERLPGVVEWRTRLGFALADAGDLDGATAELTRALELRPGSGEARVNLGTVRERQGRTEDAEALYRRALEDDPTSREALLNLARLAERQGREEDAATWMERAMGAHPGSAAVARAAAEQAERRGDTEEALAAYRRAVDLDPNLAPAHNNRAVLLERLGRPAEAEAGYRAAVAADPGYAAAWFNLADLRLAYGHQGEAAVAYRRGLDIQPDNAQARKNLALAEGGAGTGAGGGPSDP